MHFVAISEERPVNTFQNKELGMLLTFWKKKGSTPWGQFVHREGPHPCPGWTIWSNAVNPTLKSLTPPPHPIPFIDRYRWLVWLLREKVMIWIHFYKTMALWRGKTDFLAIKNILKVEVPSFSIHADSDDSKWLSPRYPFLKLTPIVQNMHCGGPGNALVDSLRKGTGCFSLSSLQLSWLLQGL